MTGPSRRSFLLAVGAGAAGAAGLAAGAAPAEAATETPATIPPAQHVTAAQQERMSGALIRVHDARTGKIGVLVGEREVILHDPAVVAAVLSAIA